MAQKIGIEIFLVLVIGLALGLLGPFGTHEMLLAVRVLFWMVYALIGYCIFRPTLVVGQWVSAALGVPPIIGIGLGLLVAAVPTTTMVALLFTGFDLRAVLRSDGLPTLYFDVWLVGFLINGFFMLTFRKAPPVAAAAAMPAPLPAPLPTPHPMPSPEPEPDPAPETTPQPTASAPTTSAPTLADRLAAGFGAPIALKGEDHYVRVFSVSGEAMILIRLRDAMDMCTAIDGMQVHRSWWVARDGVSAIRRDGRTAVITLTSGVEVPVARDKIAALRAAGWH